MTYRLPLTLRVTDGESLLSMLNRAAHLLDVTLDELIRMIGAASGSKRERITHIEREALTPAEQAALATALHLPVQRIAAGTVEHFEGRALMLSTGKRRVAHFTLWSEPDRGAVCPDCLREGSGRQLLWRLAWTTVCDRHQRLLIDTCPYCQRRIPVFSTTHATHPDTCGAGSAGDRCKFDLRLTSGETLDPAHPISTMATRLRILIAREPRNERVRDELNDYRAVAVGLLNACDERELQHRAHLDATDLSGLWSRGARVGAAPPAETLFTAALLAAADQILHNPDKQARSALIRPLLSDSAARSADRTPFAQLRAYRPFSHRFATLAIHALDGELSTVDRLRYRSPTYAPLQPDNGSQQAAEHAARYTPQLFWPELTYQLAHAADGDADTYRSTLSTAYALIGRTQRSVPTVQASLGWGDDIAPRFRAAVLGDATRVEATIRWLCELRGSMNPDVQAIDYNQRRQLDLSNALPDPTWDALADLLGWPRGASIRRRCVNWLVGRTLTGQSRPQGLLPPTAAQYTSFLLSIRAENATVLNSLAARLVRSLRRGEPPSVRPVLGNTQQASLLHDQTFDRDRRLLDAALDRRPDSTLASLRSELHVSNVQLRLLLEHRTDAVDAHLVDPWGPLGASRLRPRNLADEAKSTRARSQQMESTSASVTES